MAEAPPIPVKQTGNWRRRAVWIAGSLILLIAVALLALRLLATTSIGRDFAEARIEALSPAGQSIRIEGLDGDLLGRLRVEEVHISDNGGQWLTAEDISLDWSPMTLVSGHLKLDEVLAGRVAIDRRPMIEGSDTGQDNSGLPFDRITLGRFDISEIDLAEGLAGPAARFSTTSSLRQQGDSGEFTAEIAPLDLGEDRLLADLKWGEGNLPLSGEAALNAPEGGVFATLLRLAPGQALTAELKATGDLNSWQAEALARVNGTQLLNLQARRSEGIETLSAEVDLSLHPLTESLAGRLGQKADITARRSPSEPLSATFVADTLEFRGVAVEPGFIPRTFDIEAQSNAPSSLIGIEGISLSALSLEGRLLLESGESPQFDGQVSAADFAASGGSADQVSGPVKMILGDGNIQLDTDLSATGFTPPGNLADLTGNSPELSLEGAYEFGTGEVSIVGLSLELAAAQFGASGRVKTDLSRVALDGRAQFERPAKADLGWTLSTPTDGALRLSVDGPLSELPELPPPFSEWVDGEGQLSLVAEQRGNGSLAIDGLRFTTGDLALFGTGSRQENGFLTGRFDFTACALSAETISTAPIRAELTMDGLLDALELNAHIQTDGAALSGNELTDIDLTSQAVWTGTLAGTASLSATTDGAPLSLRTGYRIAETGWALEDLEGRWAALTAKADLSSGFDDLAALTGSADISGSPPAILPAENIEFTTRIDGATITLDGKVSGLSAGPLMGANLELSANGTPERIEYALGLEGGMLGLAGIDRPLTVSARGNAEAPLSGLTSLDLTGQAELGEFKLETAEPLVLATTETGRRLDVKVEGLGGGLTGWLETTGDGARVSAALDGIALEDIMALAGRIGPVGEIAGEINLDTSTEDATGDLRATLTHLATIDGQTLPLDVLVTGNLAGDALRLTLDELSPDSLQLDGAARLPVDPRGGPLGLPAPTGAPIDYQIALAGEVEALTTLALPPELVLQGEADVALSGSWPSEDIHPSGQARLSGGRFEHGALGLTMEDIALAFEFTPGLVVLQTLSARDPGGGTLDGRGEFALDGSRNTLEISAERLTLIDRRGLEAKASGVLSLDTVEGGLALTGDLNVDRADINIDALPRGAGFTTLDVTFRNGDEPAEDTEPADEAEPIFNLDVAVTAPGRLFVSGSGLDAELALNAAIQGTASDPRIEGQARVVRGDFDLAGKRFVFRDSSVRLDGRLADASLDIQAVRDTGDLEAIVAITGTPGDPSIALNSTPQLPEDEVLSRILFGRSPTELSPLQTAQLAGALAELAGGNGFDLVGGLEDSLGLDNLDIGFSEENGATLTTGQYIAEDVYLELETAASGLPRLIIEWRPRENIEVEADVASSIDQELSIKWTRDFD